MIDILAIAKLCKLSLSEAEQECFAKQLNEMTKFAAQLEEVTLSEQTTPFLIQSDRDPLRNDSFGFPQQREQLLQNAPAVRDGYFYVPQVMGEDV